VLLVEDNAINQEVARELLEGAGLQVDTAWNGLEAIRKVDHGNYDAVLMDIQMPEVDGYQATERIREKTQHAELPIIAMTAHALAGYREECLAAGMNDYVTKPIEPEDLFEVLGRWVRGTGAQSGPAAGSRDQAPEALPLLDHANALRRVGGNEALLLRLLGEFRREQAGAAEAMDQAIRAGRLGEAERLAHTLKGVAGNLGAKRLHAEAALLEKALAQGTPAAVAGLAETLRATLAAIRAQATAEGAS